MIVFKLNLCSLPISEVKHQCKISPLSRRHDYFDSLFLYKLLNGTVNCPELLSLIGLRALSINTRHNSLFYIVPGQWRINGRIWGS